MRAMCAALLYIVALSACTGSEDQGSAGDLLAVTVEGAADMDASALRVALSDAMRSDQDEQAAILSVLSTLSPDAKTGTTVLALTRQRGDTGISYNATAIFDAIPDDDSIGGKRYDLTIARTADGGLEIVRSVESWRCWPDRGHRSFSTEPCS